MSNILPLPPTGPVDPGTIFKIIGGIVTVVKNVWGKIKGKDPKQEEIARQKGVNPEKSTADEIAELNKLLMEYRQNISAAADAMERQMIVECSMMLQEIMDTFNEYNKNLNVMRSDSIKRQFSRIPKELKGTFAEYVQKKISLDNAECVKILRLPAGDLKKQRLQEMKQKVFIDAGNEIINRIKDAVDDFSETVEDAFADHLERAEEKIQDKANAFDELSKVTDDDGAAAESVMLKSNYLLAVCEYVEEALL